MEGAPIEAVSIEGYERGSEVANPRRRLAIEGARVATERRVTIEDVREGCNKGCERGLQEFLVLKMKMG
ncbi:hypothetical protein AHAS_Ahas02G0130900 [Arachis hypogaea]